MTDKRDLPVISLFSGAMGLDLGLERAGFRIAVALECNPYAIKTIRQNRPSLPLIDKPIESVTTDEILAAAGLKRGEPIVVAGGPSCQVFSTAGTRQSFDDPRGTLFEQFARVVRESQPRFFVMENVRGLISAAAKHRPLNRRGPGNPPLGDDEELGSAFRVISDQLRELNYYTVFDVLNAADYGTPQARQRLLMLGSRDAEGIRIPEPTHDRDGRHGRAKWRTLRDAIGDLNEADPEFYRFCPAKEKYLVQVPEGGNWRDLPSDVQALAMGRAFHSWGGRSGFFRRLSWSKPSPALTTRPDSKATSLCHPTELRPLSVREYARVQEFPDDWEVAGMIRKKYEQVGNAVPLSLGSAAGRALMKAIAEPSTGGRLGAVECWNLDLLGKLTRRPRTIVNPPRMRQDTERETITDWYKKGGRMRRDALEYVPLELRDLFQAALGRSQADTTSGNDAPLDAATPEEAELLAAAE
ncbi:DNA cytosine methyltransferase [Sphingomonas sp. LY54]|uniref:DNA cytosine methyltransferase n=1 Tax=Sphingomonas sp. LY54 TaxID=3095343 RepID=UPI002D790A3D|nr:DNA cytosine methyltransferase [Sphingomonas sp. LY54]WRP29790.1 DNA cytosine methyltransferase [Sphingomonas sp. LY54]